MGWNDMPALCWASGDRDFGFGFDSVLAGAVDFYLSFDLVMECGTSRFQSHGAAIQSFYQHMFWFYSHPHYQ
jgi:heme/copper-type cytochrome/quinol oxidase subunit 1